MNRDSYSNLRAQPAGTATEVLNALKVNGECAQPTSAIRQGRAPRGMIERCVCKLGPYINAANAPDHCVDTAVHGILQPRT